MFSCCILEHLHGLEKKKKFVINQKQLLKCEELRIGISCFELFKNEHGHIKFTW